MRTLREFTGVIRKDERSRLKQQRLKRQRVREQDARIETSVIQELATQRHPKHGLVYGPLGEDGDLVLVYDDHKNEFWVKRSELTEVTPKRPQESRRTTDEKLMAKLCPICEAGLRPKQKTCSVRCRVALLRRRKKGIDALVAVACRVLQPKLERLQLAARRKLRVGHKQRRKELREYVALENAAMRLEIEMSDKMIAEQHAKELKAAAGAGTLGTLVAQKDRESMTPLERERWRARNLPREEKPRYWKKPL